MDFNHLASELLARSESLVCEWFPDGRRRGHEYVVGDLNGSPGDSLSINLNTGQWADFATGERGGDLIALYAAMHRLEQGEAFKQLTNGRAPACMAEPAKPKPPPEPELRILLPAPADAPVPSMRHPSYGQPIATWCYRDADGAVLGYVARYEPEGQRKQIIPWTFAEGRGWIMKQFPRPRPLYGLEYLAQMPDRPVMLVEGEKAAEAARRILRGWVVVTWPGGAQAIGMVDWKPLHGRDVTIWPDADEPGTAACMRICEKLDGHAKRLRYIDVSDMPDGWDAADAGPEIAGRVADWARPRVRLYQARQEPDPRPPATTPAPPVVTREQRPERMPEGEAPGYSDTHLAESYVTSMNGDVLWCETWGRWMVWQGDRWVRDETLLVQDQVTKACAYQASMLEGEVELTPAQRRMQASRICSYRTISGVERLARSDRRVATHPDEWDSDIWLLNTPGGVVDLRDGSIRAHRREDKITKSTAATPGGDCPTWLEFLRIATEGNDELIGFLRRMVGYMLTGSIKEHALFFVYGTGGNGKGTFLNTITRLMADYQVVSPAEVFTEGRGDRHLTELARLVGARLVSAQETEEGRRWAESRIKALTGGDPITANFMRQDHFTFLPQFKLLIAGNHKPRFRSVDEAIRRRLHLIPFTVSIPAEERDLNLSEKLWREAGGILQWAIEGCIEWQRNGLMPPDAVKDSTDLYLAAEDSIQQWIDECCIVERGAYGSSKSLYQSWSEWCAVNGEYAGGKQKLANALESKGFIGVRDMRERGYRGIKVDHSTGNPASSASCASSDAGGWGQE